MHKRVLGMTALAGIMSALAFGAVAQTGGDCDRDCLIETMDNYIAALAANDPSAAPLAPDLAFVEDITRLQPGEGLWRTATAGPDEFSIHVPDPVLQSAGWIGVLEREDEPALVAIRLKLEDGRIVEAEHLTTGIRPELLERLRTPRPGLLTDVPPENRKSHEELIQLGHAYYDALDDNDGTLMPFAPDCQRHENGMITAGPGAGAGPNNAAAVARDCAGQLSSNVMAYITTIEHRRVFAADPVRGLVMGFSHFRHPMDFEPYEVTHLDGTIGVRDVESFGFDPFDLPAAHISKIGPDGLVYEIEAMGFMTDYNAPTGWE